MRFQSVKGAVNWAVDSLKYQGEKVDPGHWQGVSTEGKPDLVTRELMNLQIEFPIPHDPLTAVDDLGPNMPWAEDHFLERVGREPTNPGEQYKNWPWWRGQDRLAKQDGEVFTHTYQERFWPRWKDVQVEESEDSPIYEYVRPEGIRYLYGDLDDVVNLLRREPQTRQATFPIFFPEDTGAVHGGRIPCTLHYHFLVRNGRLHCWYPIRSCDAVRHFRDDLYMACRLVQWVLDELRNGDNDFPEQRFWEDATPGMMHFTAYSFHVHMGDYHLL